MQENIIKAILYKEWIKIRKLFWIPLVVLIAFIVDTFLKYKGVVSAHGSSSLWLDLIYKQSIHFVKIQWTLIGGAILIACLQFLPECSNKRLRLLFHMPISYRVSIYTMLSLGVIYNVILLLLACFGLFLIFNFFNFPPELYIPMIKTIFPWGLAAFCTYFATASIIAESSISRKIGFVFAGAVFISLLTQTNGYNSINSDLWKYILISIFWIFTFESAALRTKEGKV